MDNNFVANAWKNNKEEFELHIDIFRALIRSPKCNVVFYPFPTYFRKTAVEDSFSNPVIKGRYYEKLAAALQNIEDFETDAELCAKNKDQYELLKWIWSTKKMEGRYLKIQCGKRYFEEYRVAPFKDDVENVDYLFHGSKLENWHSIMQNGIINASNTKFMQNGAAYGSGIYLSDNLEININYSDNNNNKYLIGVYQINDDKSKYLKTPGIYVVTENVLELKYLIRVPPNLPLRLLSDALVQRYVNKFNNLKNMQIKVNEKIKNRINVDIKFLEQEGYKVSRDENLLLLDKGEKHLEIVLNNQYPFEAPVIYYKNTKCSFTWTPTTKLWLKINEIVG